MIYRLLGKEVRGRFGFPSGEIATNSDTARWMLKHIKQIGFYTGKSTTIEPRPGNREDIFERPTEDSGWNAVGYTNPGLEAMIEAFYEIKEAVPSGVFLMPQIGESTEEAFAYCVSKFDKTGKTIDGIELNVSCPHAKQGGILIGSDPNMVYGIVAAARKATKKPLVVKLNAGVPDIVAIAKAALAAGANTISAINTLGGPNPELSNKFGGLSGAPIFPVTYETVKKLKRAKIPVDIVMGGITGASDIRKLEKINPNAFYAIGTTFAGLDSKEIKKVFPMIQQDWMWGSYTAEIMIRSIRRKLKQYEPFVIRDIIKLSDSLKLFKFYQQLHPRAEPGQYVALKIGDGNSKPFSVANNEKGLELVIRKVGEATSKAFELKKNSVVRIKGPLGKGFDLPRDKTVVYVGAGCGIAPIHNAARHHKGENLFVIGATTKKELVYLDNLKKMGEVVVSTDDGTAGYKGFVPNLLERFLKQKNLKDVYFFNCGPEIAMKKVNQIEKKYTSSKNIYHLVERMTSCSEGICGKCSVPNGKRACVDGPVFSASEFTPGQYTRDKTGKKIAIR